jgi:hypothetical protein
VTEGDRRSEQQLRAQVKVTGGDHAAHCAVLADFYEQNGQPSRAVLWRTKSLLKGAAAPPADLVVRDPKWRRKVMMWLVGHVTGHAAVARAFKSSPSWTGALIRDVTRKICLAANAERHYPTLAATRRLQAAGALPKPFEWEPFELGEVPPESWPVTREQEQAPKIVRNLRSA